MPQFLFLLKIVCHNSGHIVSCRPQMRQRRCNCRSQYLDCRPPPRASCWARCCCCSCKSMAFVKSRKLAIFVRRGEEEEEDSKSRVNWGSTVLSGPPKPASQLMNSCVSCTPSLPYWAVRWQPFILVKPFARANSIPSTLPIPHWRAESPWDRRLVSP